MSNRFEAHAVHDATIRARDIRGAYMAHSLSAMVKAALGALSVKAPQAGHRSHAGECSAA